jgi:vancomycin resistance protein VanW
MFFYENANSTTNSSATPYLYYLITIVKKIIPASIKLFLKLLLRKVNDLRKGYKRKFALTFSGENNFIEVLCIQQPIKPTPSSINKQHNIQLAAKKMNGLLIEPGQIFSFWKLAGSPAEKNGYQKSRTIIKGEIDVTVGGGLCQLSGLIYYKPG